MKIETLDNPGWLASIDLEGTTLKNKSYKQIQFDNGTNDWMTCAGDATKLTTILHTFKDFVRSE